MKIENLTSDEILKISHPESIFSNDAYSIKREYRILAKIWHPDHNKSKNSDQVFQHIYNLYNLGLEKIYKNVWEIPGIKIVTTKSNKNIKFRFKKKIDFELGFYFIGNTTVSYFIESKYKNLFSNYIQTTKYFNYKSKRMEDDIKKYLPSIIDTFETNDNYFVIILKKEENLIRLRDVFDNFDKRDWDRHIAWIMSTLHNLICYLRIIHVAHNDISIDNYYINPIDHSGCLIGGWFYSRKFDEKLIGLPKRTYNVMSINITNKKEASDKTDIQLIKMIGKELSNGYKIPDKMLRWFNSPTSGDVINDYKIWREKILIESFGKYSFTKMNICAKDVYKEVC